MAKGTLYLLPVPLAEHAEKASYTILHYDIINNIKEYVVENEKTARKFLKEAGLKRPQSELIIHDYGKHSREKINYTEIFKSVEQGSDMGLMSEAGCPGVADPGADVVFQAHRRGIRVIPLVGPSSILLGLMASGFNGQNFSFKGYLPIDKGARTKAIKDLENQSARERSTQIFIETPFRNNQMLSELLKSCKPQTKLCVACNVTGEDEYIKTKTIADWRNRTIDLHKKPCIFLIFAS
ncbi:SAM-dependent methyltransferase [Sphingobacterium daejeonense]|uniref:SAM-dependent methyltransferase n=1 Tax=Sphingobacterium daejeonense TaxID=371142 RepID=UPI0010C4A973|nr:SAM-dependent methyltransferase [Sphingobacterium daejeonense]VTQ08660.1 Ribosomal RNA small subunit methyltransferase I [Sphingobacterium daejeonense]